MNAGNYATAAAVSAAPVAPNAQNICAIVMLIIFAILFLVVILVADVPMMGYRRGESLREIASELKEGYGDKKKWKRSKMLAWLGFILSVVLALVYAFENFQLGTSILGQNAAMMAEIVIAVIFIILTIPIIMDCKGAKQGVAILILVLSVIWIIVAAVIYAVQVQQIQTIGAISALLK